MVTAATPGSCNVTRLLQFHIAALPSLGHHQLDHGQCISRQSSSASNHQSALDDPKQSTRTTHVMKLHVEPALMINSCPPSLQRICAVPSHLFMMMLRATQEFCCLKQLRWSLDHAAVRCYLNRICAACRLPTTCPCSGHVLASAAARTSSISGLQCD
jgi:hypothetical protein